MSISSEETGVVGSEIESRQGIGWQLFKKNVDFLENIV
jgi:hypothetical protein